MADANSREICFEAEGKLALIVMIFPVTGAREALARICESCGDSANPAA